MTQDTHETREYGRAYPVAKAVVKPVAKVLWRIHATGMHHLPDGAAIFCPNHISFFDSIVLPAVLPRRISYVGKAEYLDSWKTKYIFPAVGMIPIDRGGGSSSQRALDTAARVLGRDEYFGIYPEGTRSRDGVLHRGRTGAARLALRTGAPIVPVGIRGTDQIQPAGASVPRPFTSCQVNIGEPIDVTRYLDRQDDRMLMRQLTDEVMFEIRKLSGQDYVDVYAGKSSKGDEQPAAPAESVESAPEERTVDVRVPVLPDGRTADDRETEVLDERPSSADVLAQWWT